MDPKSEAPDVEVRLLGRIAHRYKVNLTKNVYLFVKFQQIRDGEDKKIPDFYKDRSSKRSVMEIWAHEKNFENDQQYSSQFAG